MAPPIGIRFSLLLFLPATAFAGGVDPFQGLTVSMTYPKDVVTHYSATPRGGRRCRLEGGLGGRDESPSGLRPSQYRLDHPGTWHGRPTVLAAVPQRGGNSGIFGCYFGLPDAHPGVLFYAGDRYGRDSNNKIKTDISSPCTSVVNKTQRSRLVVYNCPGKKGGYAPPLKRDPAQEPKPKPVPMPKPDPRPAPEPQPQPQPTQGGSCSWYAILLCNRTLDESNRDRSRIDSRLQVINTSDFSNFSGGWYCVAAPASSQSDAAAKARAYRRKAPTAYAKKGC
jgi:hypothetical protein